MATVTKPRTETRTPLNRERVLRAAVALADKQRHRRAQHAPARPGARRRGHVALQPRRQQGRPAGRHGRPRLHRNRSALEPADGLRRHAPAGYGRPRGAGASHLGDRPHGVAHPAGSGDATAPRRGDRLSTGGRLLGGHGRARLFDPAIVYIYGFALQQASLPFQTPEGVAGAAEAFLRHFPLRTSRTSPNSHTSTSCGLAMTTGTSSPSGSISSWTASSALRLWTRADNGCRHSRCGGLRHPAVGATLCVARWPAGPQ